MSPPKQGKVEGMRFAPLEKVCGFRDFQPGDLRVYAPVDQAPDADNPGVPP